MLAGKTFDVEHALDMYATSYVFLPASGMYDEDTLRSYSDILPLCHIYLIGLMPRVDFFEAREEDGHLVTCFRIADDRRELRWELPPGGKLKKGSEGWYVEDAKGGRFIPNNEVTMRRLNDEQDAVGFEVLYIGQAYGKDGSRHALDRLQKHETLQKISLQGISDGYSLSLLLLEIEPNRMLTLFNPHAKNKEQGRARIARGLDKLFDTNEAERVTLYEASLIRYFQPKYNKEFRDSFPSTNLKVLADCYDKDFSGLVAEICIDALPFKMFTTTVPRQQYHIARCDLHDDEARKMFFI